MTKGKTLKNIGLIYVQKKLTITTLCQSPFNFGQAHTKCDGVNDVCGRLL